MKKNEYTMSGKSIRESFLQYFTQHGHTMVASSGLVPFEDPTLLFINAGMNQFKDVFLGKTTANYTRATSCQKVVRAGGKHNDLENVGRTARHHTFFEMLGNFSFGDYFKKEAISFAWNFLTKELNLPEEKLFVSVFKDDDEAFDLWRDMIGLPEKKIIRMGAKDNFWQMGDTGPCGPCSEIYIDRGKGTGCGEPDCAPGCDCDRHLELWNLVFMQYNRDEKGILHPLPKPSIDTGMGLERIASVIQNVDTNYDTDLILPIIEYIAELSGKKYKQNEEDDISLKVIADHARSTTFLIADGVLPANEGRGYVLRRIMRRAMRHGNILGMPSVFFYKICAFVIDFMKDHYVELSDKKMFVEKVVQSEEEAFSRTLNNGLKIIREDIIDKLPPNSEITGEVIFKLYDTYGFPVDLLKDVIEDAGYTLDMDGFNKFMEKQQEMAKKAGLGLSKRAVSDLLIGLGSSMTSAFSGYDSLEDISTVSAIIQNDILQDSASIGEVEIITLKTPFYPEGGGQVGDVGVISTSRCHIEITGVYRIGGAIVHKGSLISGKLSKGDEVVLKVDGDLRRKTEKNHTATHLLHKALQLTLGEHARQAGSNVTSDGFRFDFTHFGQITGDEIEKIENTVNSIISNDIEVRKLSMSMESAMQSGAMALFGEKYGDEVRVVDIEGFSRELCGGCHVSRTSQIGLLVIVSESSIASGVRRIEGLTGASAFEYLQKRNHIVKEVASALKSSVHDILKRVFEIQADIKEKDKQLKSMREQISVGDAMESLKAVRNVNGVDIVTVKLDDVPMDSLRSISEMIMSKLKADSGIVVAGAVDSGKVNLICRVSKGISNKYKAGELIREIAKIVGGSGGGKDDIAQAGGKDPSKLDEALEIVYSLI